MPVTRGRLTWLGSMQSRGKSDWPSLTLPAGGMGALEPSWWGLPWDSQAADQPDATVHETGPSTSIHAWTSRRARLDGQQVTERLSDPPVLEFSSHTLGDGVAYMTHDRPVRAPEQPRVSPGL